MTYVLSSLFGDCNHVRIVETFAEHPDYEFSAPDVSRRTGIVKSTIYRRLVALEKDNIIVRTRRVGNTQLYKLNLEEEKARAIVFLEASIVSDRLTERIEEMGERPLILPPVKRRPTIEPRTQLQMMWSPWISRREEEKAGPGPKMPESGAVWFSEPHHEVTV